MRLTRSMRTTVVAAAAFALLGASPAVTAQEPSAGELDRRLKRLENIVNSGQLADILQRLDTLAGEIRQLRGEIETQSHRLDELRKRQRNLYADLDRRIRELEVAGRLPADSGTGGATGSGSAAGSAAVDSGGDAAGAAADAAAGAAGAASGGSSGDGDTQVATADAEQASDPAAERQAYDAAFQLLREGRYQEAGGAFQSFLEQFPAGPYADNARYWLGEARYVTRNFAPALDAFEQVIQQHPGSAKVPDARLKMGYTLYEMGRYDEARQVLQKVIEQHPDSAVARLAEERIVRMNNEGR